MENEAREQNLKTPLYDEHVALGGKLVDFHGWMLPIQYGSILQEHECVRERAGLFDVSHMGEIEVSGPDALAFLQEMLTNDILKAPGKAVYSPMCYQNGGAVDDLIVYQLANEKYLLVVNASNIEKDYHWLLENRKGQVSLTNRSEEYAEIALQGPEAKDILQCLVKKDIEELQPFHYIEKVNVGGYSVMLSRTGYTGEDGYEIYCRPEDAKLIWNMLLERGASYGLKPAGLGARDTLRLEAALPLYGQELSAGITPVMAGLRRFVKPVKGSFNGRETLLKQLEEGPMEMLAGFEMLDRAVPRSGYEVFCNGRQVGAVTSGGFFPTLKKNMGLALLDSSCAAEGGRIEIKVRDSLYGAKIVKLPFYKRAARKG